MPTVIPETTGDDEKYPFNGAQIVSRAIRVIPLISSPGSGGSCMASGCQALDVHCVSPQTDGTSERAIRNVTQVLRGCASND
jgi:hypothetical protein